MICSLPCCRKDFGELPRVHNIQPEQKIRVWKKKKETQGWEHKRGRNEAKILTIKIHCCGITPETQEIL